MRLLMITSLALLTACGADGPPVAPSKAAVQPAISITGTAKIGVVGS
ncbi:MAG: argininosuccinate lyase [Paracoccaceae bacterium]